MSLGKESIEGVVHINDCTLDESIEMRPQTMADSPNGRMDDDGVMLRSSEIRRSGKLEESD